MLIEVKIRKRFENESRVKAQASITLDGAIAIHDIKVIEGLERLFVAMPSRREDNGIFRDIAHPITPEFRRLIEEAVLQEYKNSKVIHS